MWRRMATLATWDSVVPVLKRGRIDHAPIERVSLNGSLVAGSLCRDADWVRAQSGAQSGCRLESASRKRLILNGEMSEWLKEHAWKAKRANITEQHRNTCFGNRFNDLWRDDAARCEPVNTGIRRRL